MKRPTDTPALPSPPTQQVLFEVEQTRLGDGSIVVRPRRLVDGNYIGARRAAAMLGFRDTDTIYAMVKRGELKGWKPAAVRGNGRFRIELGSVLDYKATREGAVRD